MPISIMDAGRFQPYSDAFLLWTTFLPIVALITWECNPDGTVVAGQADAKKLLTSAENLTKGIGDSAIYTALVKQMSDMYSKGAGFLTEEYQRMVQVLLFVALTCYNNSPTAILDHFDLYGVDPTTRIQHVNLIKDHVGQAFKQATMVSKNLTLLISLLTDFQRNISKRVLMLGVLLAVLDQTNLISEGLIVKEKGDATNAAAIKDLNKKGAEKAKHIASLEAKAKKAEAERKAAAKAYEEEEDELAAIHAKRAARIAAMAGKANGGGATGVTADEPSA